ncbi:MAG: hypothetical protein ACI8Q1_001941 [Parvicella sp.]|jgi:hypothetical protein
MKSNNILSYLLILFMILGVSSCKDDEPTNTNNNSNKSGATLTLEYNGETENYIIDDLSVENVECLDFFDGTFEFPMIDGFSTQDFISIDFHMAQSNYPIKTGEYNTDDLDCGDLDEGDDNACYLDLTTLNGVFDFGNFAFYESVEGKFNLSTLSDNKITFNYVGKIEVTKVTTGDVLGVINVTYSANSIPYEDNY